MDDNDLLAADLAYQQSVQYTYERDHSSVTSWLDHVLCYDSLVPQISNVARLDYGSNLSHHHPVGFTLDVCCSANVSTDILPTKPPKCQWFKAIPSELESYRNLISASLPTLPVEVVSCTVNCTSHLPALYHYYEKLFTCFCCSRQPRACIPHSNGQPFHLAGFNDAARNLKTKANFCHRVWLEAGYPSVGVLFQIKCKSKARFKYEVRRLKRRQLFLCRQKMADALVTSSRDFWREVKRIIDSQVAMV